nr:hypothetical protein [Gracilibacillus halophilus]
MNQMLLWSSFILPWLLLIPLQRKQMKRFLPAALFGALLLTIVFQVAEQFRWWEIQENIIILTSVTPFVYGIFLVGTIIILYFTYFNFWVYIITNLIIDAFLSFGVNALYEYLGIYRLIHIDSFGIYALTILIAVLIYSFQRSMDKVIYVEDQ